MPPSRARHRPRAVALFLLCLTLSSHAVDATNAVQASWAAQQRIQQSALAPAASPPRWPRFVAADADAGATAGFVEPISGTIFAVALISFAIYKGFEHFKNRQLAKAVAASIDAVQTRAFMYGCQECMVAQQLRFAGQMASHTLQMQAVFKESMAEDEQRDAVAALRTHLTELGHRISETYNAFVRASCSSSRAAPTDREQALKGFASAVKETSENGMLAAGIEAAMAALTAVGLSANLAANLASGVDLSSWATQSATVVYRIANVAIRALALVNIRIHQLKAMAAEAQSKEEQAVLASLEKIDVPLGTISKISKTGSKVADKAALLRFPHAVVKLLEEFPAVVSAVQSLSGSGSSDSDGDMLSLVGKLVADGMSVTVTALSSTVTKQVTGVAMTVAAGLQVILSGYKVVMLAKHSRRLRRSLSNAQALTLDLARQRLRDYDILRCSLMQALQDLAASEQEVMADLREADTSSRTLSPADAVTMADTTYASLYENLLLPVSRTNAVMVLLLIQQSPLFHALMDHARTRALVSHVAEAARRGPMSGFMVATSAEDVHWLTSHGYERLFRLPGTPAAVAHLYGCRACTPTSQFVTRVAISGRCSELPRRVCVAVARGKRLVLHLLGDGDLATTPVMQYLTAFRDVGDDKVAMQAKWMAYGWQFARTDAARKLAPIGILRPTLAQDTIKSGKALALFVVARYLPYDATTRRFDYATVGGTSLREDPVRAGELVFSNDAHLLHAPALRGVVGDGKLHAYAIRQSCMPLLVGLPGVAVLDERLRVQWRVGLKQRHLALLITTPVMDGTTDLTAAFLNGHEPVISYTAKGDAARATITCRVAASVDLTKRSTSAEYHGMTLAVPADTYAPSHFDHATSKKSLMSWTDLLAVEAVPDFNSEAVSLANVREQHFIKYATVTAASSHSFHGESPVLAIRGPAINFVYDPSLMTGDWARQIDLKDYNTDTSKSVADFHRDLQRGAVSAAQRSRAATESFVEGVCQPLEAPVQALIQAPGVQLVTHDAWFRDGTAPPNSHKSKSFRVSKRQHLSVNVLTDNTYCADLRSEFKAKLGLSFGKVKIASLDALMHDEWLPEFVNTKLLSRDFSHRGCLLRYVFHIDSVCTSEAAPWTRVDIVTASSYGAPRPSVVSYKTARKLDKSRLRLKQLCLESCTEGYLPAPAPTTLLGDLYVFRTKHKVDDLAKETPDSVAAPAAEDIDWFASHGYEMKRMVPLYRGVEKEKGENAYHVYLRVWSRPAPELHTALCRPPPQPQQDESRFRAEVRGLRRQRQL